MLLGGGTPPLPSLPVIGMPGEDGHGAIELLGEHDADELMRPGDRAECQAQIGAREDGLAEAIWSADRYEDVGLAAIAPVAQTLSEGGTTERRTMLVERQKHCVARHFAEDRGRFLVLACVGAAGPALRNFGEVEG